MVKQGAISDGWVAKESNERLTVWLQRVGGRWVVESLGILRCAQDDSDNKQQGGSGNLRRRTLTTAETTGSQQIERKFMGIFQKRRREGLPLFFSLEPGRLEQLC